MATGRLLASRRWISPRSVPVKTDNARRLRLHHHRRRLGRRGPGGAAERGSRHPRAAARSRPRLPHRRDAAAPAHPQSAARHRRRRLSLAQASGPPDGTAGAEAACGAAARSAAARPSTARSPSAAFPRTSTDWVADGAAGWGWQEVLPYFRKLESDVDFGDAPYHGKTGPIPVYRAPVEQWGHVDRALMKAAMALGYGWCDDHNAPEGTGVSPYAINSRAGPAHLGQ